MGDVLRDDPRPPHQAWLWVRPEARYDWARFQHPFNDGTRGSQFMFAFDVVIQF